MTKYQGDIMCLDFSIGVEGGYQKAMKELTQAHKAKEPERTETNASWGLYVAGTNKNYLLRVALLGYNVPIWGHKLTFGQ